ncbi:FkbM family methyltransferase [Candidatus Woesearchaeota archaeon]|jgi:FkbM family methyltransferase|nr:FkbM family methyltransferase [Candidatus Woesearchaeota archaeon]MBT6045170.1 FkbM family methyltransferase [Candidatus Woesearchaeota archaeon]
MKLYIKDRITGTINYSKHIKNWYSLIKTKLYNKERRLLLKFRNGLKLNIMNKKVDSDITIIKEIYVCNNYNRNNFNIEDGDVVLDLGANIGIYSTYATTFGKGITVYAYEASPKNFEYLKGNIELNNLQDIVKPYNEAVTSKNGKIKFFLHDRGSGGNSMFDELTTSEREGSIEVKSINLPSILKENKIKEVGFLKMDIEGAEYETLLNCPSDVIKRVKKIAIECHNVKGYKKEDLIKYLIKNGFMVWKPSKGMVYGKRVD